MCTAVGPPRSRASGSGGAWTGTWWASTTRSSPSERLSVAPAGSRRAAASTGALAGPRRSARPSTQRRAENVRTSGTSVDTTSPAAASSSRRVRRGSRQVWAGT